MTPSPPKTFSEVSEAWIGLISIGKPSEDTLRAYRGDLRAIGLRLCGARGMELSSLTVEHLTKAALRTAFATYAAGHAKASVLRVWHTWHSFFTYLVAEDICEGDPMTGIPRPKVRQGPPKSIRGERVPERILAAAEQSPERSRVRWASRDLALMATFIVTGARRAEVCGLTIAAFSGPQDARRLTITGKGDQTRTIPLEPSYERIVKGYLDERAERFPSHRLDLPTTPLFVDVHGEPLTYAQLAWIVEGVYVQAGIRADVPVGAMVHALRHTFAQSAIESGTEILEVQALLGHRSLDTTKRYVDATASKLRAAVVNHPGLAAVEALET